MKRIVIISLAIATLLLGILFIAPTFIDWSRHKPEIEAKLKAATGFDFKINGHISLVMLPFPHAVLEGLTITNPSYNDATILTLEKAEVSIALAPLFSGKVDVNSISLVKPNIDLSMDEYGSKSWMTPVLEAKENKAPATSTPAPQDNNSNPLNAVVLKGIKIKDGAIKYTDKATGKMQAVAGINLDLEGDSIYGPYTVAGTVSYNKKPWEITAKTGKINSDDRTLSLQSGVKMPQDNTALSFSGVLDLKAMEVQGDTIIESSNLAQMMSVGGGAVGPKSLAKPLAVRGLLTASAEGLAYRNMKLSLGAIKADGALVVKNLKKGAGPLSIETDLKAEGPVDLAEFFPAPVKLQPEKGERAPKPAEVKPVNFLPDSITLPRDMSIKINITAPLVKNKDLELANVNLAFAWVGQIAGLSVHTGLAPDGIVDLSANLSFASTSKSEQTGAITLAQPSLTYKLALKTGNAARAAAGFVPEKSIENILPLLKTALAFTGTGAVESKRITLTEGALSLQDTTIGVKAIYEPKRANGRDFVALSVASNQWDLDKWMGLMGAAEKPAATVAPADPKASIETTAQKINVPFDLTLQAALKNVTFKGTLYNDVNIQADLLSNKLAVKTFEFKDNAGNHLLAAGTVADVNKLTGIDLSLQGQTQNAKAFLSGFKIDTKSLPGTLTTADMVTSLKGDAAKLAFTSNLKAMGGTLDASGSLADLLNKPVVSNLTLRLKHANYGDVMRLFSPNFKATSSGPKNLDVYATMALNGKIYTLNQLQATIGPAVINGDITADTSGEKPSITAKLQMGDVPLHDLLGQEKVQQAAQSPAQPGSGSGSTGPRWSTNKINLDWMNKFNLDLDINAKSISYGTWQFSNPVVDMTLNNGLLTLANLAGGMYGGTATLSGVAQAPAEQTPLSIDGKASLQNVALESFVSSFSGSQIMKAKGNISVDTNIKAAGDSAAALVGSLSGQGTANGQNLVMEGFDLAKLSRTLVQPSSSGTENITNLLGATMQGGSTSFEKLAASFVINNGIININPLTLTGQDATVNSPGIVNLPQGTIDMESVIKLAQPANAPELKVSFKGPLDNPGQTFGKSAMESYMRQILGQRVQQLLGDKLKDNPGLQNILQGVVPGAVPATAPPATNDLPIGGTQPVPMEPAPANDNPPAEMTPEDAFRGILDNVLQGR